MQGQIERLARLNATMRNQTAISQQRAQALIQEQVELQVQLHDKEHEIKKIREQLREQDSSPPVRLSPYVFHSQVSCLLCLCALCKPFKNNSCLMLFSEVLIVTTLKWEKACHHFPANHSSLKPSEYSSSIFAFSSYISFALALVWLIDFAPIHY